MRQDYIKDYGEYRDSIDNTWFKFLHQCNLTPCLLPNDSMLAEQIIQNTNFDGILLTGGGEYDTKLSDERSKIEHKLLSIALTYKIPLIGVCRGMQAIQQYFGMQLYPVQGQVTPTQSIKFNNQIVQVNSYHTLGTTQTNQDLIVKAIGLDNIIKSVSHISAPIEGIMWHPERNVNFSEMDIQLFKSRYNQ